MRRRTFLSALTLPLAPTAAFAAGELSNRRAPGFALQDQDLKTHDLADYMGKVVVIDIMRTACPHCATFSQKLQQAEKAFGGRVKVLQVVNPPDNQASVKKYRADHGLSTTILWDCSQMAISYLKVTPQKPTIEVPHVFVVDTKGWIREDYGYNLLSRGIFEGDGLMPVLEKYAPKTA
ncbi:MAG: redoxin domain-containing protein [Acidobacteria bacterium]|nr:redoxin domain-containing protein [Acidobacteriota bacterium]